MLSTGRAFFLVVVFVAVQLVLSFIWIFIHNDHLHQVNAQKDRQPLLTLFTTMKPNEQRTEIHLRALRHVATMKPHVHPVLMVQGDDRWVPRVAEQFGWTVWRLNETGPPRIRVMFQDAVSHFDSKFYAFCNADILFDKGLIETLRSLEEFQFPDGLLVAGQRHNLKVESFQDHLKPGMALSPWIHHAELFGPDAQDYFISTKNGFPWERVPDLVIGRPAYDNWLLTQALVWGITLVDATDTVFALHQTGADGNKAGWKSSDKCTNRDLVGPYVYSAGRTYCAKWKTEHDFHGRIRLVRRPNKDRPGPCHEQHIGYNTGVRDDGTSTPDPKEVAELLNQIFPPVGNADQVLKVPWPDSQEARKIIHHILESVGGKERLDKLTPAQRDFVESTLRESKLIGAKTDSKRFKSLQTDSQQDELNKKAVATRKKKRKKGERVVSIEKTKDKPVDKKLTHLEMFSCKY
ncbi:hypothetical protein CAPTEDRAFT_223807 [Capitella teleta]|uniref:Uncharacterized protein n=1 Tax=Capitella teleta TaxID=283909 RepID=R7UW56_CAPTE|nr:hypothetical protein CAPTEDRAFT_223807 [Capitella teleta]|eukprot:ELU10507.1 hypothetical protein CAPTEDRAFT_223807 [Capitella teleta]